MQRQSEVQVIRPVQMIDLRYGCAPPIPLSHLVQLTEMLTKSGGRGQRV